MSDSIDISGLDKAAVLAALFNGSRPQGLGFLAYDDGNMTVDEARVFLNKGQTNFGYLNGRVMKVDLSEESFDPWGYDRDNGANAANTIIDELRRDNVVDGVMTTTIHEHGRMHAANQASEHLDGQTHPVPGQPIPTLEVGFDEFSNEIKDRIQPYLRPND